MSAAVGVELELLQEPLAHEDLAVGGGDMWWDVNSVAQAYSPRKLFLACSSKIRLAPARDIIDPAAFGCDRR